MRYVFPPKHHALSLVAQPAPRKVCWQSFQSGYFRIWLFCIAERAVLLLLLLHGVFGVCVYVCVCVGVEILPFNGSYDLMKRHLSAAQLDVYKNQCVVLSALRDCFSLMDVLRSVLNLVA